MLLNPYPRCSSNFTFAKDSNKFIGIASDFGFRLGRIYDDACDEGFTIVSKRTGKSAVFALTERKYNDDNDLCSWEFVCVTPGLSHLKAVVFND